MIDKLEEEKTSIKEDQLEADDGLEKQLEAAEETKEASDEALEEAETEYDEMVEKAEASAEKIEEETEATTEKRDAAKVLAAEYYVQYEKAFKSEDISLKQQEIYQAMIEYNNAIIKCKETKYDLYYEYLQTQQTKRDNLIQQIDAIKNEEEPPVGETGSRCEK